MTQLAATPDSFGGVTIGQASLPAIPDAFARQLEHALAMWEEQGVQLVWLTIPIEKSALVPVAVSAGFSFHHCSPSEITLVNRLVGNAFIPPDATHFIGAGAVVLSERDELLVVLERYEQRPDFYKLPGGLLNPGEHIADAVVREVLEETGVRTTFDALLCLGQWHEWRYGKSNIYFVCRLLPLSRKITIDESEIAEARWMPLDTYLNHPSVGTFNKRIVETTLNTDGLKCATIEPFNASPSQLEVYFL